MAEAQCVSVECNGHVEALHRPELLVPYGKTIRKNVQRYVQVAPWSGTMASSRSSIGPSCLYRLKRQAARVVGWADLKHQSLSGEGNGLAEVLPCTELLVSSRKIKTRFFGVAPRSGVSCGEDTNASRAKTMALSMTVVAPSWSH